MKKINIILALFSATVVSSMALEWEIGIGSNYGGILGVTANHRATENIELYGGIALLGGVLGTRFYIDKNIRLNANYGVNGYGYSSEHLTIYHGFNLGMDYIGDNGFTVGITTSFSHKSYNLNETIYLKNEDKYTPNIALSIGYRF